MRATALPLLLLVLSGAVTGCGDANTSPQADSGTPDATAADVGTLDATTADTDAGPLDAYVDPCGMDNGGCDPLTSCTDTEGDAVCGACPGGYLGDGLTGCEVDACATANGGCDALRLCASEDAQATCGACVAGYQEDGAGGCEVDACATSNGGCDPNRACSSAAGVATCGDCDFGYDDDLAGGCIRNACTLARTDTYEPDAWLSEVRGTLTSQPMTWHRSLAAGEEDWFFLRVAANCAMTMEWTHEGASASGATYRVWSPAYGAATTHASGSFSESGTDTVPGSVPAGFEIDYEVAITAGTLCASYSFTAGMTCP